MAMLCNERFSIKYTSASQQRSLFVAIKTDWLCVFFYPVHNVICLKQSRKINKNYNVKHCNSYSDNVNIERLQALEILHNNQNCIGIGRNLGIAPSLIYIYIYIYSIFFIIVHC